MNDGQKSKVMEMTKGDMITLRGKITSICKIIGSSVNIDEIN